MNEESGSHKYGEQKHDVIIYVRSALGPSWKVMPDWIRNGEWEPIEEESSPGKTYRHCVTKETVVFIHRKDRHEAISPTKCVLLDTKGNALPYKNDDRKVVRFDLRDAWFIDRETYRPGEPIIID